MSSKVVVEVLLMIRLLLLCDGQIVASQGGPYQTGACRQINDQLQAAFRCRPNDFHQKGVCEGDEVELRCPRAEFIVILSAEFGRTRSMCSAGSATDCPMTCIQDVIERECSTKRKCKLVADERTLGRPCVSRGYKYLTIVYKCVSKATARLIATDKWKFEEERCEPSSIFTESIVQPRQLEDEPRIEPSTSRSTVQLYTTRSLHDFSTTQVILNRVNKLTGERSDELRNSAGERNKLTGEGKDDIRDSGGGRNNQWAWDDGLDNVDMDEDEDTGASIHVGSERPERVQPLNEWKREREDHEIIYTLHPVSLIASTERSRPSTRSSTAVRRASVGYSGYPGEFDLVTDWIQTLQFMSENREKLILYSVLSVCVGIICVLLGVVTRLTCHRATGRFTPATGSSSGPTRRFRAGKHGTGSSEAVDRPLTSLMSPPGWRMPDSSSSITGCDRSIGDEDVEMMSFNRLDSLNRSPVCPQHSSNQQQQQQLTLTKQQQQPLLVQQQQSNGPVPQHQQQQQWLQQQQQPLLITNQQYKLSTLPLQSRQQHQQQQQLQVELPKSTATINRSFNGQMNAAVNRIGIPPQTCTTTTQQNGHPSPMYANGPNYSATMPANGKIPLSSNCTNNAIVCPNYSRGISENLPPTDKLLQNGRINSTSLTSSGNSYPLPPPLSMSNGSCYHGFGVSGYTLPGDKLCSVHSKPGGGTNLVGYSPHMTETRSRAGSLTSPLYSSIRGDPASHEDDLRTLQALTNTTSLRA